MGIGPSNGPAFWIVKDSPTVNQGDDNFGSPFDGGAPFALCDGSVRLFTYGSDITAFLTYNGGDINPPF